MTCSTSASNRAGGASSSVGEPAGGTGGRLLGEESGGPHRSQQSEREREAEGLHTESLSQRSS